MLSHVQYLPLWLAGFAVDLRGIFLRQELHRRQIRMSLRPVCNSDIDGFLQDKVRYNDLCRSVHFEMCFMLSVVHI